MLRFNIFNINILISTKEHINIEWSLSKNLIKIDTTSSIKSYQWIDDNLKKSFEEIINMDNYFKFSNKMDIPKFSSHGSTCFDLRIANDTSSTVHVLESHNHHILENIRIDYLGDWLHWSMNLFKMYPYTLPIFMCIFFKLANSIEMGSIFKQETFINIQKKLGEILYAFFYTRINNKFVKDNKFVENKNKVEKKTKNIKIKLKNIKTKLKNKSLIWKWLARNFVPPKNNNIIAYPMSTSHQVLVSYYKELREFVQENGVYTHINPTTGVETTLSQLEFNRYTARNNLVIMIIEKIEPLIDTLTNIHDGLERFVEQSKIKLESDERGVLSYTRLANATKPSDNYINAAIRDYDVRLTSNLDSLNSYMNRGLELERIMSQWVFYPDSLLKPYNDKIKSYELRLHTLGYTHPRSGEYTTHSLLGEN